MCSALFLAYLSLSPMPCHSNRPFIYITRRLTSFRWPKSKFIHIRSVFYICRTKALTNTTYHGYNPFIMTIGIIALFSRNSQDHFGPLSMIIYNKSFSKNCECVCVFAAVVEYGHTRIMPKRIHIDCITYVSSIAFNSKTQNDLIPNNQS